MVHKSGYRPAFPMRTTEGYTEFGISVRQYYAGQALAGLLADPDCPNAEGAARTAFRYADAMIEFEEKESEQS